MRVEDLVYLQNGDLELQARVYRPDGDGPFPCLVSVHGGSWVGGDRSSNARLDSALVGAGYLVASPEFRMPPPHPYPAASQDIHAAVRWLKNHARELEGNADRVGVVAMASGAQTALVVGLRPFDEELGYWSQPWPDDADASMACFVACSPILDPTARYEHAKAIDRANLIANHEANFVPLERSDDGNPRLIVERGTAQQLPPVLILHGTADANIPVAMQERFLETYRAAEAECDLELFDGLPHGFANDGGAGTEQALARLRPFLERHLA